MGFDSLEVQTIYQLFSQYVLTYIFRYVYKRLKFLGIRWLSRLLTLLFVGLWHGVWPGYYITFILEFIGLLGEETVSFKRYVLD